MLVIVPTALKPYGARMIAALFRFMTLLALVLMPFGMTMAPAIAQTADHTMAMSGHCDETQPRQDVPAQKPMDCTASCTALPASDVPLPIPSLLPTPPRIAAVAKPFSGIDPELATPPPKLG